MLYSHYYSAQTPQALAPVLVFLHGLLGSGQDWQTVIQALPHYDRLSIDLPGHGHSQAIHTTDFETLAQQLSVVLGHVCLNKPLCLIGYSLGGRIALTVAKSLLEAGINLVGVIVEGGHVGGLEPIEQQARWQHDQAWAQRFKQEPIAQVLSDWYQQPVFASLNHDQRQALIVQRRDNLGNAVAELLLATSLAVQPYRLDWFKTQSLPLCYVCGEQDIKFYQLAQVHQLAHVVIPCAGHNAHREQPVLFAAMLNRLMQGNWIDLNEDQHG